MARLRLVDDAENNLQELKVKWWRQKANNRKEWASVIEEANILKGP